MSSCFGCISKSIRIAQQAAKISQQRRVIHRQRKEIRKLNEVIQRSKQECSDIISEARTEMSQHLPRGSWSFFKGRGQAAIQVLRRLG